MVKDDKEIRKLNAKIAEQNQKMQSVKEKLKQSERFDQIKSQLLHQLIEAHLRNKNVKSSKSRKRTSDDKIFALNILKRSVPAYEFSRDNETTCSPSERTVQRQSSELSMDVGLDDDFLQALGKKY